jgi:hypothetical protein
MRNRDWKIGRRGRSWSPKEFRQRIDLRPEKLEIWKYRLLWTDGQRVNLVGLLLENLGADRIVRLGDPEVWRAAVAGLDDPTAGKR